MKTIIFTVTNDLSYDQRMIRICTSLTNNGYNCILVGRKKRNSPVLKSTDYQQKRLNLFFEKGKLFYLEYNIRLLYYLLFKNCDAICSIDVDTVLPGLWVARLHGKKHIFDAHELFTHVPEVVNRPIVQKVWAWVQKIAFTKTNYAYTVGSEIAAHFETLYKVKVDVVRNAPLLKKQLPYTPDKNKFILYQGALNKGRGIEALIEAMQHLDCRLVLAGDGDLTTQLRNLAELLGVSDKVQFLGYVLPADLPAITQKAYIGMNASENAGLSYYLSLNNKFFDYIHAGLPSLINPFPEYITLNLQFKVGVLTPCVVSDIVANAKELLNNPELHKSISQNCLAAARELNWEKEEQHLLQLYRQYFAGA